MSKQSHRSRYTDIVVILGSLVVVGGAISMIHTTKKDAPTHQTNIDTDATDAIKDSSAHDVTKELNSDAAPLLLPPPTMHVQEPTQTTKTVIAKSNETLKTYIAPLIAADDIKGIADILKGNPVNKVVQLTDVIITDKKSLLSYESKVQLILALALNYDSLAEQSLVFDLFTTHKQTFLKKYPPILSIAATDLLGSVIPSLLGWAKIKENNPDYRDLYDTLVNNGLEYAVSTNKPASLWHMIANGVPINSKQATGLLWKVVEGNKNSDFIPLLKECAANFDDIKNKKTPLITAIINHNENLVIALLDNGASANFIPAPDTGSPLQQAIIQKQTDIELLLRNSGAKE